jgi:hypothetical protein
LSNWSQTEYALLLAERNATRCVRSAATYFAACA